MSIEFGANISMKIEGAPDADTLVNIISALSRTVARR
jgi:hypothetical protein